MARSRSLFDDLDLAIATATSLAAGDDPKSSSHFISKTPLVSFEHPIPSMPDPGRRAEKPVDKPSEKVASKPVDKVADKPVDKAADKPIDKVADKPADKVADKPAAPPLEQLAAKPVPKAPQTLVTRIADLPVGKPADEHAEPAPPRRFDTVMPPTEAASLAIEGPAAAPPGRGGAALAPPVEEASGEKKLPPKLPDLSNIASPVLRCEKIVTWIAEATGATDVFLADSAGYPLAGAIRGVEAKLASVGVVASSLASLTASIPGSLSPLFELHIGEGPFFQIIGFQAGASVYVVGFSRGTPLTPRQAHAIRLACRHALGDTLRGGLWESE